MADAVEDRRLSTFGRVDEEMEVEEIVPETSWEEVANEIGRDAEPSCIGSSCWPRTDEGGAVVVDVVEVVPGS